MWNDRLVEETLEIRKLEEKKEIDYKIIFSVESCMIEYSNNLVPY